jgi:hypothetical protein
MRVPSVRPGVGIPSAGSFLFLLQLLRRIARSEGGVKMADQSVNVTNLPDSGSSQNVAFKLWDSIRWMLPEKKGVEGINQSLDLYATCLQAASHARKTRLE